MRLSQTILELDRRTDHVLLHTGQNWDPLLSDIFFSDFGLRQPDHQLSVPTSSLGAFLGGVLEKTEEVLLDELPDAVLVLGDTNSSIAALMAKRQGIPVFHMEAGNRCFDENVPEEINRRLIDHIADFNLCYTEHARRNLLAEGLKAQRIFVTGSPMPEVLQAYDAQIEASDILNRVGLGRGDYLLVSMHREENVDNEANLTYLLTALTQLRDRFRCQILISTHPRLRLRLRQFELSLSLEGLRFLEPLGFFDYNKLQRCSLCVLSDSGTISEESVISGFPAVTIRNAMERPEALDAGSIVLTGLVPANIERAVSLVIAQWADGFRPSPPAEYSWTDCSKRVSRLIAGLAGVFPRWLNLESRSPRAGSEGKAPQKKEFDPGLEGRIG